MGFSFTGVAYSSLFFAIALLAYRFFQYWRKRKDTTSGLIFWLVFIFSLFALDKAVSGLIFANNRQILFSSAVFAVFIETLTAVISVYLIFFIFKLPKIVSQIASLLVLAFGLYMTNMTISIPYYPFIGSSGSINWGFPSVGDEFFANYNGLRTVLLLTTFIPLIIIFVRQYRGTSDRFIRDRSIGLMFVLFMGVVVGLIDFIFINVMKTDALIRDIVLTFLGLFLFLMIYLTQKPPKKDFGTEGQ
jgi:hypothetical protein